MDVYSVNVKVNDRAKIDLEGTADEADLTCGYTAFLNISNLNSEHLVKKVVTAPYTSESNQTVAL
jgi:hypothetical protein